MKTRSRLVAAALAAASLTGLAVAAPATAADTNIDLGRFTIRDNGRSVDWTVSFRCNRGDELRAYIDLAQRSDRNGRNDRDRYARGDARSDRIYCDGGRQRLYLNIRADDGRFRNGRARAEVSVSSNRGNNWNNNDDRNDYNDDNYDGNYNYNNDNGNSNRDRNRDFHVTQWVQLRGGGGWDD